VEEFLKNDKLTGVQVRDLKNDTVQSIDCDGVFVSIGRIPETGLLVGQLDLDENGYVLADESTKTNLAGVFAAGDVRTKPFRQVITAASDGAVAASMAEAYFWSEEM
jgi:thioredoxin reductase (NADPH)